MLLKQLILEQAKLNELILNHADPPSIQKQSEKVDQLIVAYTKHQTDKKTIST